MDPTMLLKRQHRKVEQLFKQVEKAEDGETRRELLDEITENLELHMSIEEEIFYPAVREIDAKKAQESIDEAFEEHHVIKLVLGELPRLDVEDDRFEAKMTVLSELVEHHVEEEEKEMFKIAKRLGKEELQAIGEQMMARLPEEEQEGGERAPAGAGRSSSRGGRRRS